VHRQVAQMKGAKLSEGDMNSNRLGILRIVLSRLEFSTIGIRFAGARKRTLDRLAGRGHYTRIETGNSDLVTGFRYRVLCLAVKLRIRVLQKGVGCGSRLSVCSMVDVLTDGNSHCQFSHSAEVITMPMRDNQMINLLKFGIAGGCNDAIGIARSGCAGVTRVNQERLALRGHQERRVPGLHVHDINVQRFSGSCLCVQEHERKKQKDENSVTHSTPLIFNGKFGETCRRVFYADLED